MKDIYIVLSDTKSLPSKLINLFTRHDYSHVSISTDDELRDMYSFGRKYLYFPWYGGFISENIHKGMFIRSNRSNIAVYRLTVKRDVYEKVNREILDFKDNEKDLFYDYFGIIGMKLGLDLFRPNGYVCSSFTHEILSKAGVDMNKDRWEIYPTNFREVDGLELVYEGLTHSYTK